MLESEQARLQALQRLAILDTPPEERFDRITRLAIHLFEVDIALVSLVDEARQWFKSRQGFPLAQTCRTVSFCAHAIKGEGIFEIEDASKDSRFENNQLVTSPGGIRFYAGVPLTTSDGFRVGTLCVIDSHPRRLSYAQRQALIDLATCVEEEINRIGLEQEIVHIREARRRLEEAEHQQRTLVHALASLNEISTSHELSLAEQLNAALALGCGYFNMQIGIISRIENNMFEVVSVTAPEGVPLSNGLSLPLANTYCDMTLKTGELLTLYNVGEDNARHHPCYSQFGLEAYIGIVIYLDGEYFGTLSFSSDSPRDTDFSEADKLFIKLLSRWVSAVLERQRVDTLKNEFVSIVSHELRTPLTSVIGGIKLVLGGVTGEMSDQTHDLLSMVLKNSERLGELINDLLDMEKLLAGQINITCEPYFVNELLSISLEENQAYADQLGITLKLTPLKKACLINVDFLRFQQIMANLLSNAAKFSLPGSNVIIVCDESEERIRINVKDTGCGIPSGFKKHIFKKFSQADGSDQRSKNGTGLGLSISKALTERMGGTIGFSSEEGEGSTFYITFPCLKENADANA